MPSPSPRPFLIPSLDGLRAVAILIVFLSHAGLSHIVPGLFGVTVFFFLSGYLITTLISIFGPARRVSASAQRFSETRARPNGLGDISVDVMTHVSGTIDFHSGAVATVVTSWEMWAANLPQVEIYGTTGTIGAPNPDHFTGLPNLRRGEARDLSIDMYPPGGGDWRPMPMTHRGDIGRSLGIAEMAHALRTGTKSRSDMEFGYHALEVMLAFEQSSSLGQHVDIVSTCDRPAPLPPVSVEEPVRFD